MYQAPSIDTMAPNILDNSEMLDRCSRRSNLGVSDMRNYYKRRNASDNLEKETNRKRRRIAKCSSATVPEVATNHVTRIIEAVEKLSTDSNLIADGSRVGYLPTVAGKHKDLNSISTETMSAILKGQYSQSIDHVTIIDCRYPYEYDGGHIEGAINLYTKDSIQEFINETQVTYGQVHVLIFHCEFSSERGPKMYRFLRSLDRDINKDCYPRLNFPEVYLLEGGYKAFYQQHETRCEPQSYLPMLHENHGKDLRHFRVKSKSWSAGDKPRPRFRAESIGKKLF